MAFANAITLAKEYLPILDEVYASESLTSLLDVNQSNVRPTGRAGSFEIQKLSMVGLGTYNRTTGFPNGDITATWEEKTYAADRGRSFTLDAMDAEEAQLEAVKVLSEFIRTKVVPEVDAYRFAAMASASGIGSASATLASAASVLAAWDVGIAAMGNAHVNQKNLVGYMSYSRTCRAARISG